MPFVTSEGARIYYRLEGREENPLLVLVHSLGADHGLWTPQIPALLAHFRVLRVDLRGHGASDATPGDYTVEQLARDILAVVDTVAGGGTFAFCGLSLGGMIGQWLGANAAERIARLVLANTTARVGDPGLFDARGRAALEAGMDSVADIAMQRSFSARALSSQNPMVASIRTTILGTNPAGYAGCCAAIRDMDHTALLARVRVPTLVIGGDQDASMPWNDHGAKLAAGIPGAQAVVLPAGHLANLERPSSFSDALLRFLLPEPADKSKAGVAMRRAVLGDAHVDRAIANTTDFTRDFQDLITQYAWGSVWTRPGLDPRTRRLLVLAMTAALGRWEEFRLHVHTGLADGLELTDLRETLLQVAVYAGVPAANSAFHIAVEESRQTARNT